MALTTTESPVLAVEQHGVDHIEESARHGRPSEQFTIRFSPLIQLAPITVGAIGIQMGLGLVGTATAVVAGSLAGALLVAACAVMGPRLGMPQVPIGRAAFGRYGNLVPAVLTALLCLGYFTIGTVFGADSFAAVLGQPYVPWAIAVAVAGVLLAIFGYDLLHLSGKWIAVASVVVMGAVSVLALVHGSGAGAAGTLPESAYPNAWLIDFGAVFAFSVTWAPYASDYSRYLPSTTRPSSTFWWSTAGLFAGTAWMMLLGALVTTSDPKGGATAALDEVLPGPVADIALLFLGISMLGHNAVNIYANATAILSWGVRTKRWIAVAMGGIFGGLLAVLFGQTSFVTRFEGFLSLAATFVMPWLAIVLIDYYLRHRSGTTYRIADFDDSAGPYRGVNASGMTSLALGIAAAVPFLSVTGVFTGPWGTLAGGNLSYLTSFVVAGCAYLVMTRPQPYSSTLRADSDTVAP